MAKKTTAKKVAEVKEVKAPVVEEKAVETAPVVEEAVTEKKKPGRKPGSKNTTAKTETKKVEKKDEVFVQFAGEEFAVEEVMEKAKAAYIAEGHRASAIKSVRLYIKPEERKAYYVINDKAAGSIEL
ncbi:MAG: hypothetical protein IJ427_00790 [Lachnospiraceae bacterium]|nr:hypothetical protein [Lachnospiraceae bacterium]MBQ8547011.1 hypothetical protein [Lachnospiraceae bacterium]MBQ8846216.1 hypothetical protein [Lachnospiraceae bacterium]